MMRILFALAVVVLGVAGAAAQSFDERVAACVACHGANGQSQTPEVPSLAGQQASYLLTQLYLFREKIRPVEIMNDQTQGFSDDDLKRYSDFFAKLGPPAPASDGPDQAKMEQGRALVSQHHCNSCHAPDLAGQDQVPRLAAQREDYLVKSLRDYKSDARPGYDPAMASVVEPLKDADFAALAYYIARAK
jgi:cytochrome c553